MEQALVRLDAISEMLALSSVSNTKNVIITGVEARGPFDKQAWVKATALATKEFPQLRSLLRESKIKRRHYLHWVHGAEESVPVTESEIPNAEDSGEAFSQWMQHMETILDRQWDLFDQPPAFVHIARVSEHHHVLSPIIHHAASDAGTASEFGRTIMARYHELVTGERPSWGEGSPGVSTMKKRMVQAGDVGFKDFIRNTKTALTPLLVRPTLPIGTGAGNDTRQWQIKMTLSQEETLGMVGLSRKRKAPMVDVLVSVANRTIDLWNASRNVPQGIITTSLTVNMKGRYEEMESPNSSAVITFRSTPEERQDPDRFVRNISVARIKQFRRNMDFRYFENVTKLTDSVRLFPFRPRSRIVHALAKRHQYSIGVTFLGVVWPEIENGRPTGNSAFKRVGNFDIGAVYGIGYKLLSDTHLLLICYIFEKRLNLVLAASGCHFTKAEADQFMDLILLTLKEQTGT